MFGGLHAVCYGVRATCLHICVHRGREMAGEGRQGITKLTNMHSTYCVPGTVRKFLCILAHLMFLYPIRKVPLLLSPVCTGGNGSTERLRIFHEVTQLVSDRALGPVLLNNELCYRGA